jgi:hypothetical protein
MSTARWGQGGHEAEHPGWQWHAVKKAILQLQKAVAAAVAAAADAAADGAA